MPDRLVLLHLALLAAFLPACIVPPQNSTAPSHPNIILFLVDDLGWQDVSVPLHTERTSFNDRYRTINVERLAEQGMKFTNAYAASPVCTPTRTSLMTGRNPARTHITYWTLYNDLERQRNGPEDYPLDPPAWKVEGLQPGEGALPEILRENGYRTIHVGKAHFGALETPGADPLNLGFDVNVAGHAAGAPGSYLSEARYGNDRPGPWAVPGLEAYYETHTFLTEALTIEANEAIDQAVRDGVPFFMNMAHYAVHVPLAIDDRYFDRYLAAGLDSTEAMYAGLIEGYDASLGSILENLEEEGVADRTLILFLSDNGGLSAHARGKTPEGTGAHTHNRPLRSGKGSAYEGGTRIPMVVSWAEVNPGDPVQARLAIPSGSSSDFPVISDDFFPTVLDLAGIPDADRSRQHVDGVSLARVLTGDGTPDRHTLYWHFPHKWGPEGPGLDPFSSIRDGDWKAIYFYNDQRWELYDLATDLGETTDHVRTRPDVARRLAEKLTAWMDSVGAQTPVPAGSGEPLPLPDLPQVD